MRREYLSRRMDVQQRNVLQAREYLAKSQFATKLLEIPSCDKMFKFACDTAGGAYVKVKDSNALVGRSLELAMNISYAVADKLAPIAERGINVASPLTTKVDAIAAESLKGLIDYVPVIKEQPNQIVNSALSTTRSAIEKKVTVLNGLTESVLKTRAAQGVMDIYESILGTACNTLDNVLPPSKEEKSNGYAPTKESLGEEDKHKRGVILAQRTFDMFSTCFKRLFGYCQTQVENTAHAADVVYKQVKSAVSDSNSTPPPAAPADQNNTSTNGDASKQPASNKKGKKKNQE